MALVDRIYGAALDAGAWGGLLDSLSRAFYAPYASLIVQYPVGETATKIAAIRADPTYLRAYVDHHAANDPMIRRFRRLPSGAFGSGEDLVSRDDYRRTEVFQEWWRPQRLSPFGIGASVANEPGGVIATLSFARRLGTGPFEREDVNLLGRLTPHVLRAVRVQRRLLRAATMDGAREALVDRLALGVIVVDERGRVRAHEPRRRLDPAARDGLSIGREGLRAAGASADALRSTIARTVAGSRLDVGGTLALPRPSGRRPLCATVIPLERGAGLFGEPGAAAAIFVSDPDLGSEPPPATLLQRLYGLTRAEALVALRVAEGRAPKEIAGERRTRLETVRTQLKQVFAKTRTDSQAALVRTLHATMPQLEHATSAAGGPDREEQPTSP